MIELNNPLKLKDIVESDNIAELLTPEELTEIGIWCHQGYEDDISSRSEWEERQEKAMKVAMQVVEKKSFPWSGASNVKFPVITIAALNFQARAYPALIDAPHIVNAQVIGEDPTGQESLRAQRISTHMSYQIIHEDKAWEADQDKNMLILSILGTTFKKNYFDPVLGHNVSELVLPRDYVVDYWSKPNEDPSRGTHIFHKNENWIIERQRRGIFLKLDLPEPTSAPHNQDSKSKTSGTRPTEKKIPFFFLEQHCWMDLDGDGFKEPYIVTLRYDTKQVFRIVARFLDDGDVIRKNDLPVRELKAQLANLDYNDPKSAETDRIINQEIIRLIDAKNNPILRIVPIEYFTQYIFIPSPDGSYYGIGLGQILGATSTAIDTIINQLIDNGTLRNTSGGFIGRGARMRKGQESFSPFEWKPIESTGDDLRKSMIPLPVNDVSQVSFPLLELLIGYCERIAGTTDVMVGESPGQNTKAETMRSLTEQGMKTFSAIYKRIWRATGQEFLKMYRLNTLYLEQNNDYINLATGQGAIVKREDYQRGRLLVIPAADPNIASDSQLLQQAIALEQSAASVQYAGYNPEEVQLRKLRALKIKGIDRVYGGLKKFPPPPNPKMIEAQSKDASRQADAMNKHNATMSKLQVALGQLMLDVQKGDAEIAKMQAEAAKLLAEAKGVPMGHAIAILEAQIGAAKAHQEGLLKNIEMISKLLGDNSENQSSTGMEAKPANTGVQENT